MESTGASVNYGDSSWRLADKLRSVFLLIGYSTEFSAISASALIVLIYTLARQRAISLVSGGAWVSVGLLVLFLVMPFRLLGVAFMDVRIMTAALLIVPAFIAYKPSKRSMTAAVIVVSIIVIIGNVAMTAWVWRSYRKDYEALKSSLAF